MKGFSLNLKGMGAIPKMPKVPKGKAMVPGLTMKTKGMKFTSGKNITNVKGGLAAARKLGKKLQ